MPLPIRLARRRLAGLLAAAGGLAVATPAVPGVATDEEVRNAFLYAYRHLLTFGST